MIFIFSSSVVRSSLKITSSESHNITALFNLATTQQFEALYSQLIKRVNTSVNSTVVINKFSY